MIKRPIFVENSFRAIWGILSLGVFGGMTGCGSNICERPYTDINLEQVAPAKMIEKAKRVLPVNHCNSPAATNEKIREIILVMRLRMPKYLPRISGGNKSAIIELQGDELSAPVIVDSETKAINHHT